MRDLVKVLIIEALEASLEEEIEALAGAPEFSSIEDFVTMKLDEDESSFSFIELQALARREARKRSRREDAIAGQPLVEKVKADLLSYGLKFVPRGVEKKVRGVTSPAHGTSPWAGTGGGGSGFGSDFGGSTFTSFGGGPGAVGGGYAWKADDPRNLPMSSKRKR